MSTDTPDDVAVIEDVEDVEDVEVATPHRVAFMTAREARVIDQHRELELVDWWSA